LFAGIEGKLRDAQRKALARIEHLRTGNAR